MTQKITYKILFFCYAMYSIAFTQTDGLANKEVGKPFINYFSPKDYKSGPRNWSIVQDNRGVMYFGNESGILEYDGHYWRKIIVPGNQNVRSLTVDKNGKIYVCASADFGFLESDSTGQLKYKSLLPYLDEKYRNFGEVWDVATATSGVFFKTKQEIFRWDGREIMVWDSVFAFRLYNINDTIYSRNEGTGLMQISGDEIKVMPDGAYFSSTGVYDMLPFKKNKLDIAESIMITTSSNGLFIQKDKKFIPLKTDADNYLISNQIYNTTLTSEGNYAFATQRGGIAIINDAGKLLRIIDEKSGLPTNVVYDIFADKNEGLWLATENGIVYIKDPTPFSIYHNIGLLKNLSNAVYRFNGEIYIATELGVLYLKNQDSGFQPVQGSNHPAYGFLNYDNVLLAGTLYGVALIENNTLKKYISDQSIISLLTSNVFPNRIYSTNDYGFSVLGKNSNNQFVETYFMETDDGVTKIVEDSDGSLWLGGYFPNIIHITGNINELSYGNDSNVLFETYDKSNGLPGNDWDLNQIQNRMLLATDKGIYSFDTSLKTFLPDSSLGKILSDTTCTVSLIENGQNNELWILAHLNDKASLGKAKLQNNGVYLWQPIPELWQLDLETITSMYSDIDPATGKEKLWLSTQDGLVVYDVDSKNNVNADYSAHIRKVIVKRDSVIYAGSVTFGVLKQENVLSFSNNDIIFEFSADHFDKPNSTLFQTSLIGDEEGWSLWSSETKKEYTNLSEGEYEFRVRAKNIYGVISGEDSFHFQILAPWYYTWWAYILYSILIGSTLLWIRKFELNRKEKNNRIVMSELKAESAEIQAKAAETQARLMQADNDRKTKELEEARELQLSMLPKQLPVLPHLDIAVYMQTATEVGGDYYDFHLDNGTLTILLGDATGHGMKSGMMVSIMKSFFISQKTNIELKSFFENTSDSLKDMKLGRLMMTLLGVQITDEKIIATNAGLPSLIYYRNKSKKAGEFVSNNMPLGAMKGIKYSLKEIKYEKGDTLLLMTDGLPELRNVKEEQYGYERVVKEFISVVDKSPEEIIKHLNNSAAEWTKDTEPDDDVTFVVIKVK